MPDDENAHDELTVHADGQDPILAKLATREKTEEDLLREARAHRARVVARDESWKQRFWIRMGIVVGIYFLVMLGLASFYPEDWRDGLFLPLLGTGLLTVGAIQGWHWLLVGVLLVLVPPIAVLLIGGVVAFWFIKLPMFAGIALIAGYASTWPSATD